MQPEAIQVAVSVKEMNCAKEQAIGNSPQSHSKTINNMGCIQAFVAS